MFFFVFLESKTFRFILQTMTIYLESEFLVEFQLNAQPGTLVLASGISALPSVALEKGLCIGLLQVAQICLTLSNVCIAHRTIHMINMDFQVKVPCGFLDCCF